MINPEFCFVVGVPGSSWSMLSHRLKLLLDHDTSDVDDSRLHLAPHREHHKGDVQTHFGSYFGPDNEFGHHFDNISSNYTLEEFYKECRRPFTNTDSDKTKSIRSHWFSYNLDWIWNNCKGNTLCLIHKGSTESVRWWLRRGGWNIKHPVYTWYKDTERLTQQIIIENEALLKFASEKNLKWDVYDEDWWMRRFGRLEVTEQGRPPIKEYTNSPISIIYTEIT